MSLEEKLKQALKARKDRWAGDDGLPGVHFDMTRDEAVDVVFDGIAVRVPASRVDPADIAGSFGQAFFEGLCHEFGKDPHGSYADAKLMAAKVARKAERLPQLRVWLVHAR